MSPRLPDFSSVVWGKLLHLQYVPITTFIPTILNHSNLQLSFINKQTTCRTFNHQQLRLLLKKVIVAPDIVYVKQPSAHQLLVFLCLEFTKVKNCPEDKLSITN